MRPLSPDQKENLRDQIDKWLEQGVIEPSVSRWGLPRIPLKKDMQMRWVTDLRELNKQTIKDSYPLTNIQEILHSLQGATVFSFLDACGAYHAVRIKPGAKHGQHLLAHLACSNTYVCFCWKRVQ